MPGSVHDPRRLPGRRAQPYRVHVRRLLPYGGPRAASSERQHRGRGTQEGPARRDRCDPGGGANGVSEIVEEIRRAWATIGVRLGEPVAHGTYYRLLCAGCGRMIGNVGDRLLPGMAADLVTQSFPLYAAGL